MERRHRWTDFPASFKFNRLAWLKATGSFCHGPSGLVRGTAVPLLPGFFDQVHRHLPLSAAGSAAPPNYRTGSRGEESGAALAVTHTPRRADHRERAPEKMPPQPLRANHKEDTGKLTTTQAQFPSFHPHFTGGVPNGTQVRRNLDQKHGDMLVCKYQDRRDPSQLGTSTEE